MKHTIEKYSRSAILRLYIFRALGYFSCGECLEPFRAHPSLTSRSSPSSNNQSYRNLKLFLQQTAKIICSSTKLTYGLRLCVIPATGYIIHRSKLRITLHRKKPDLRITATQYIHIGVFHRLILKSFHRHLHIALPRTNP